MNINNLLYGKRHYVASVFSPMDACMKHVISVTQLLFISLLSLTLFACTSSHKATRDWTILVYMAADNSLDEAAISDIEEMASAQFSDDINLIIQIDHRNEYPVSDYTGAERIHVRPASVMRISKLGEIDSGDYHEMARFFNWGADAYPARRYAYVIWTHGNGWYNYFNKFCPDANANSSINVSRGEFAAAMTLVDHRPDILLLDACNMQSLEVVSEIAPYADFIIGSETSVPQDGFPYQDILPLWDTHPQTINLCSDIALSFINSYNPFGSQNPDGSFENKVSCSVVDTRYFSQFTAALSDFVVAEVMDNKFTFTEARDMVDFEFNDLEADIDIKNYLQKYFDLTGDPQVTQLLTLLDAAFPAQWFYEHPTDYSDLSGSASVWFPKYEDQFFNLVSDYEGMSYPQQGWLTFLNIIFLTNVTSR